MWREITEADVLGVLSAPEKAAYQRAATARGQTVLVDAIASVVNFCRGYLADNRENSLALGLTLPERALRPALHLLRVDLLTRLDLEVSDDRRTAAKEATLFFREAAAGKVTIESATGAVDSSGPATQITVKSSHERQATREKLAGL